MGFNSGFKGLIWGKNIVRRTKQQKNHQDLRFWLSVKLNTRLHLVPRSRMCEALPPLPSMHLYLQVRAGTNVPFLTYSELRIQAKHSCLLNNVLRLLCRVGKYGRGFEWNPYRYRNAPVGSRRATESDCRDRVRGQLPLNHGGTEVCSRWLFLQY